MKFSNIRPVGFHHVITENLHKAHEEKRTAATIGYTITALGTGTLAALDKTVESLARIPLTIISPISFNARFKKKFSAHKLVKTIKQIFTKSFGSIISAFKSGNPNEVKKPEYRMIPEEVKKKPLKSDKPEEVLEQEEPKIPEEVNEELPKNENPEKAAEPQPEIAREDLLNQRAQKFNENLTAYCNQLLKKNEYIVPEKLADSPLFEQLGIELALACKDPKGLSQIVRSVGGENEKLALSCIIFKSNLCLLRSDLSPQEIADFMHALVTQDVNNTDNAGVTSLIRASDAVYNTIFRSMITYLEFKAGPNELEKKRLEIFELLVPSLDESKKQEFFECALNYHDLDFIEIFFKNNMNYPFEPAMAEITYDSDYIEIFLNNNMNYLFEQAKAKFTAYDYLIELLEKSPYRASVTEGGITKSNQPAFNDYYHLKGIVDLFLEKGLIEQDKVPPCNPSKPFGFLPISFVAVLVNMLISPKFDVKDINVLFNDDQVAYKNAITTLIWNASRGIEYGGDELTLLACQKLAENYDQLPDMLREVLRKEFLENKGKVVKERFFKDILIA